MSCSTLTSLTWPPVSAVVQRPEQATELGDTRIDGASVAGAVWARAGAGFFRPVAGQSSRETLGNSHAEG